ncbi:MAG: hypothetical protein ACRDPW_00910 [Mycobacteriales bacterium]
MGWRKIAVFRVIVGALVLSVALGGVSGDVGQASATPGKGGPPSVSAADIEFSPDH